MQFKDIVAKRTYKKDGVDKTTWLNVGTLKIMDDGKMFVDMNHLPDSYYVFDRKAKETVPKSQAVATPEIIWPEENINPDDIPF